MNNITIKSARSAESNGDYSKALEIYAKLSREMSTEAFDYDIFRIKSKLKKSENIDLRKLLETIEVDKIYVLNLASDSEKKLRVARELSRVGLDFSFVSGVYGRYSDEAKKYFNEYLMRSPGSMKSSRHIENNVQLILKKNATIGAFGYLLSQRKIFNDALDNGYKRICVFDDDVIFSNFSSSHVRNIEKRLSFNSDWKILHLGASEYSEDHPGDNVSEGDAFYSAIPHKTCGSFATIYDESSFKEILEAICEMDGPYDNVALGSIYNKYPDSCLVAYPNICLADVHSSNIRSKRDQFTHSEKMRWSLEKDDYYKYKNKHVINLIVKFPEAANFVVNYPHHADDLKIRFFYMSDDGIRPIHAGGAILKNNSHLEEFDHLYDELNSKINIHEFSLPLADKNIFWPNKTVLNFDIIRNIVIGEYSKNYDESSLEFPYRVLDGDHFHESEKGLASVIVPTYRDFGFVTACIDSVIQQDYENIELILVFDNPDKQPEESDIISYVRESERKAGRVNPVNLKIAFHKNTRYGCGARNTGIFLSRGEFISFLDDDDLYTKSRISESISTLNNDVANEFGACYCAYVGLWDDEENIDHSRMRKGNFLNEIICLNYLSHYIHTGTVTYRRDVIMDICGFDEKYIRHQDIEMNARFFRLNNITFSPMIGMKFKPRKKQTKATFSNSLELLLDVKKKLTEDFSDVIEKYDEDIFNMYVSGHVADLKSYFSEKLIDENLRKVLINFLQK
ncbi:MULTISPECIES: glycosyltransferase [Comamonas]|uniref:glycosyltransferase n=1 Tax=Comamonas TaxID=283 RepID=UPI000319FFB6|nr:MULTISPECIES: glycosyltransferase [Comamonas]TFF59051.1 glycosyltransferase [Comamonas sp. A23]